MKSSSLKIAAVFAVLPQFMSWQQFKDQKLSQHKDQDKIRIALAVKDSACKKILKNFDAQLALTDSSRAFGLSNRRKPLAPTEAMLFIFEYPRVATFWMKETLIPMEIAFLAKDGTITQTEKMRVEPDPQHPTKVYRSDGETTGALEAAPNALDKARGLELCVQP